MLQEASSLDSDLLTIARSLPDHIGQTLKDAPAAVEIAACCVLSGGHLLVQDVPGVGKTMLAKALANALGSSFSRIQGHPDMLPSDVVGVAVYEEHSHSWQFHPGPIFANVVLIDELNRCPQRTQSAFLEAMEEGQVTVLNQTYSLPSPHFVVATQNPVDQRGTYPLVESQLDRFALSTSIGYPSPHTEQQLAISGGTMGALNTQSPLMGQLDWDNLIKLGQKVLVADQVVSYVVALASATRQHPNVELGVSPRATIQWLAAAKARAIIEGRAWVHPGDVVALAEAALSHRIITRQGVAPQDVIREILEQVSSPHP